MKLSIIIPALNEESVIGHSVQYLKQHMLVPHEIIVSDGRSRDRTVEVAKQYADKVVVFSGEKHTPARGRNDGARVASGEFFLFLDADSFLPEPEKLFASCFTRFERDPELMGITLPQRARPEVETWGDRISFGIVNFFGRFLNNVLHRGEGAGKFMMVRRSAYEKVSGFREDLVTREDGDFFFRLSRIGKTYLDPAFFVYHGARRAHKLGWPRLWWIWTSNVVSFALFDKSVAKEWTPVR